MGVKGKHKTKCKCGNLMKVKGFKMLCPVCKRSESITTFIKRTNTYN